MNINISLGENVTELSPQIWTKKTACSFYKSLWITDFKEDSKGHTTSKQTQQYAKVYKHDFILILSGEELNPQLLSREANILRQSMSYTAIQRNMILTRKKCWHTFHTNTCKF